MPQNLDDMQFCKNCEMNVFPTRPEFHIKIFVVFAFSLFVILITVTILSLSIFTELTLIIFFHVGVYDSQSISYILYCSTKEKLPKMLSNSESEKFRFSTIW